jgi:hypothetical protein
VVLNSGLDFGNRTKTKSGSVNTKTQPTTSRSKQIGRREGCKRQTETQAMSMNATSSLISSSAAQVSFYI